jgi:hypothetical protein
VSGLYDGEIAERGSLALVTSVVTEWRKLDHSRVDDPRSRSIGEEQPQSNIGAMLSIDVGADAPRELQCVVCREGRYIARAAVAAQRPIEDRLPVEPATKLYKCSRLAEW